MPPWLIPAISAGASLLGSLFSKKPSAPKLDPRFNQLINQLMTLTREGLSPEAERAFLQTGRQGIGQATALAREQVLRNISRQGLGQSGLANTYMQAIQNTAGRQQSDLARQLTLMDEEAKQRAYGELLSALTGKHYAGLQSFYAQKSLMPDWGTPLGYSLLALFQSLNSGGGGNG